MIPNQLITELLKALKAEEVASCGRLNDDKEKKVFNHITRAEQKVITAVGFTPATTCFVLVANTKPLNVNNFKDDVWPQNLLKGLSKDWDYLRKMPYPKFMPTTDPRVGFVFYPAELVTPFGDTAQMLKAAAAHLLE